MTAPRPSLQKLKVLPATATEIAQAPLIASGEIGAHLPDQQVADISRVALSYPSIKLIDDCRAWESQREREAQRLGAMTEEERAWELTPKADCPNCSTVIPFDSVTCPSCKAQFGPYSAWQLCLKTVTP